MARSLPNGSRNGADPATASRQWSKPSRRRTQRQRPRTQNPKAALCCRGDCEGLALSPNRDRNVARCPLGDRTMCRANTTEEKRANRRQVVPSAPQQRKENASKQELLFALAVVFVSCSSLERVLGRDPRTSLLRRMHDQRATSLRRTGFGSLQSEQPMRPSTAGAGPAVQFGKADGRQVVGTWTPLSRSVPS
jgi:hypothetical protein